MDTQIDTLTLLDITGQESGIVIFDDDGVILCNWERECPGVGFPNLLQGIGLFAWPAADGGLKVLREFSTDDVASELPGTVWVNADGNLETDIDIVSDIHGDIPTLFFDEDENGKPIPAENTYGTVYEVTDGDTTAKVIAPDLWD